MDEETAADREALRGEGIKGRRPEVGDLFA